jgi:hypothetical protein
MKAKLETRLRHQARQFHDLQSAVGPKRDGRNCRVATQAVRVTCPRPTIKQGRSLQSKLLQDRHGQF